MRTFESELVTRWNLAIKESSREYLMCTNLQDDIREVEGQVWKKCVILKVLGHLIASDGGVRQEWLETVPKMWAVFYQNSGNLRIKSLSIETKLSLLLRTVFCTVSWKFSRWPFQKSVAVEMDNMQSHMVSIFIGIPRGDSEDWVSFVRRRRRLARNLCSRIGTWSEAWARRVISWHEHVMRGSWVLSDLIQWKNSEWLEEQRARFVSSNSLSSRNSLRAGRTGTRCNNGRPQPRWEEGVALARSFLESRPHALIGDNALSVGTRIRQALELMSEFFNRPP